MRFAIDAMGGDFAPQEVVLGAINATKKLKDIEIVLVGRENEIALQLKKNNADTTNISIVHADQIIRMDDSPIEALRKKPDASIIKAVELVKEGRADALIMAGNTGASVAASILSLGLLKGVRRPGIAVPMPTAKGVATLIDAGANIHCKPFHLFHYGIMASHYVKDVYKIENPKIGLLNIGEEDKKGNTLVKETREIFTKSSLNFIGNIEGQDIFNGVADVIVCEGFLGNVILKAVEGVATLLMTQFEKTLYETMKESSNLEISHIESALSNIASSVDFAAYGGAPLLGVNGLCVICHGRSRANAFYNALNVVKMAADLNINNEIVNTIESYNDLI